MSLIARSLKSLIVRILGRPEVVDLLCSEKHGQQLQSRKVVHSVTWLANIRLLLVEALSAGHYN
jgi:hypothetical protein